MRREPTPKEICDLIQDLSFKNAFNPYVDRCGTCDSARSPEHRMQLLKRILKAASSVEVDAIWLGRDLGYRGGRRTGLALTDDAHFDAHLARWGLNAHRPTTGVPVKERTASVVWEMIDHVSEHLFLWNVFPLHPYKPSNEFSNRAHSRIEREAGEMILTYIARFIRPRRIVAIGNDAARCASRLFKDSEVHHVRHPSYGGQREFCEQIRELYTLEQAVHGTGNLL